MGTRTPRKVCWTLFAVAVALPVATIAPWQALASPEPAAAMTSTVPRSGSAASEVNGHLSAWAAGAEPDPQRDPDRREGGDARRDEDNDERRREQQAAPERVRGDDEREEGDDEREEGDDEREEGGRGKEPNPNCTLIVPPAPLTAQGLATPYELVATNRRNGPCREANADQSAFVEATIINPATGALSIYRPLVIDRGTRPAAPPVVPTLPPGAVVGLWFGFQGDVLTLRGAPADCVNGLPRSPFGQFAYCGAPAFFDAANAAIGAGKLKVPPAGKARDGQPCPTTRDFSVVDQDQSDNLNTSYLALANGRTAQDNAANAKSLLVTRVLKNDSDNGLLNGFIGPALGCRPFTAPDLTADGALTPSLALNELQAAAVQAQPVALIPPNNPMAQVNGRRSVAKANLYRAGVNMPPLDPEVDTAKDYCSNLATVGLARLRNDRQFTVRIPSPDPAAANNLFAFLQQRLKGSLTDLDCAQARRQRDDDKRDDDKRGVNR